MKVFIKVLYDNGVQKSYEQNNIEEENFKELQTVIFNVAKDVFQQPGSGGYVLIEGVGVINLSKVCSIEIEKANSDVTQTTLC